MQDTKKPKKNKRYSVVYRRSTHDKRTYNTNPYKPHFLDVIYAENGKPDKEAVSRVHVDSRGRYSYEPSIRYQALKRLERMRMSKKSTNEGRVQGSLF